MSSLRIPSGVAGREITAPRVERGQTGLTRNAMARLSLPAPAWSRVLVLFLALAFIKLVLLVGLRKHLHEIHWRIEGVPTTWANYAAFCGFVVLGVLSLATLAGYCRAVAVKAVRTANAVVLALGLLFIFLTFHSGDKNYLFIVMSGVLNWKDLGSYLSLDLFFQPPFLAAWLLGYALSYYALARAGRESLALYLTAAFAGLYALLCLRELGFYRNRLLVADCFGLVSLVMARRSARTLRLAWLWLPAAWTLFIWGLFRLETPDLRDLVPYFRMLLGVTLVLFAAATLLAKRQAFYQPWANLLLFYFAAFFLLTASNFPNALNYGRLLCLAIEFPRYLMGELLLVGVLSVLAALYCRLRPKAGFWWLDILNLSLIALALVDLRLSQIMDVRLGWDLISFANSARVMWRMAKPYLPGACSALVITGFLYVLALRGVQWWPRRRNLSSLPHAPNQGAWYVGLSAVLLGLLGLIAMKPDKAEGQAALRLVQTSPWWNQAIHRPLSRDQFLRSAKALGLRDFQAVPATDPLQPPRNLNVLLVFMESSYNQHLSLFGGAEQTQPLLSKYKERIEVFPNFFSNFAGSIFARFAAFTSLYPIRDFNAFTLNRVNVKSLFEVLHDAGYSCSLFYSSFLDYTGFRDFLSQREIDDLYDADTMPGRQSAARVAWGLREEATLGAIRDQIKQYAAGGQRFFLTYVPAAPHYPYDNIPEAFRKFNRRDIGDCTPFYLNELLYMDWVIAAIVDQLGQSGLLDQTLVIITNDHGEMLGANGGPIGHGWAITPELANTPLIIMDPQNPGYHLNYTIGSQVDLLPTVLDRLRIPIPAGQLYEGRSLDAPQPGNPPWIYLNSYRQYGVIVDHHIVVGDREADEERSADSKRGVFAISNLGSKTSFSEDRAAQPPAVSIQRFDHFQENLLRNYSLYCRSVHPLSHPMGEGRGEGRN